MCGSVGLKLEGCAGALRGDCQGVDLHQHDLVRQVHEHGGAAGQLATGDVLADELTVDLVHGGEVVAGGEVDAEHEDVFDGGSAGFQDGLDVLQGAAGLDADVALADVLIGGGVHGALARNLEHAALLDALGEYVRRGGGVFGQYYGL